MQTRAKQRETDTIHHRNIQHQKDQEMSSGSGTRDDDENVSIDEQPDDRLRVGNTGGIAERVSFTLKEVEDLIAQAKAEGRAENLREIHVDEDIDQIWKNKDIRPDINLVITITFRDSKSKWPKLEGPHNYRQWLDAFKSAMIVSRFWPFFIGEMDRYKESPHEKARSWYTLYQGQAIEALKYSCSKNIEATIRNITDPVEGLRLLEARNKATGNAYIWSILREFFNCSQETAGSVSAFKDQLNRIQDELCAINPAYEIPKWMLNSAFICKLSDILDSKVSVLNADRMLVDPINPTDFNILAREVLDEEQRRLNQDGGTSTTLTTRTNVAFCKRCKKTGHLDIVGQGGCFWNPANKKFKQQFLERRSAQKGKYSDRK
jgi:hypothetical protein